jgi:RNA polymerase sigma-70 factor, ECF subfamily
LRWEPAGPTVRERDRSRSRGHFAPVPHLVDMDGIALEPTSIEPMVRLAAAGDRAAFARIVAAYHPDLIRVAFVVAGGRQDVAEDAVQSAWTIAWRKLRSVREPEHIKGWLLNVAANEARQIMRRQRGHVVEIDVAEHLASGPDPAAGVGIMDLRVALRRLPPEDRVLLALRYQGGLDSGEIGAMTRQTASAVRNRLARVLARLRRELSGG